MSYFVFSSDGYDAYGFTEFDSEEEARDAMKKDEDNGYRCQLIEGTILA